MNNLGPVICVVGARPNFMKMAPILRAMAAHVPPLGHPADVYVRHVARHHRRQFGAAVPFERQHAELGEELVLQLHRQLLRAAHDEAQRAEVVGPAPADVEA